MNPTLGIIYENKIKPIRELNIAEYEIYEKAITCLTNFSSDLQLLTIVHLNYYDYENTLVRIFEEFNKSPNMSWDSIDAMNININKSILNFLSAVRTYLDHSEKNIKKRTGGDSQRTMLFKLACKKAYDNNFSYRFLSKLRNYVQHFGMPVGNLSLQKSLDEPYSKEIHHTLAVKFSRDELLQFDSWGIQLKKEIQNLPPEFEIKPHITEMLRCIERINYTLIEDDLPELIQSAEYVKQLLTEIKNMPGFPCLLRNINLTDKQISTELEWIPYHLVKKVDFFKATKSNFT